MRAYHVVFIRESHPARKEYMSARPMSHDQACAMLSKQSKHAHGRFQLEEVTAGGGGR